MYTVSHTTAMTAAAMLADLVSPGSVGDVGAIPSALASALALEDEVAELAAEWSEGAIIALGAGPLLSAAEEAHIKVAEGSRRQIRHQEPESFLHGPAVQIVESDKILAFAASDGSAERTRAIVQLCMDMGCASAWVAPEARVGARGLAAFGAGGFGVGAAGDSCGGAGVSCWRRIWRRTRV